MLVPNCTEGRDSSFHVMFFLVRFSSARHLRAVRTFKIGSEKERLLAQLLYSEPGKKYSKLKEREKRKDIILIERSCAFENVYFSPLDKVRQIPAQILCLLNRLFMNVYRRIAIFHS